ncbi:Uncharacterised protein [Clostridium tertium]|uniref:Lipoprotein n=2 Tax=Clostridium tertium TaxID=1559 RepID=A0A6N3E9C4_9CLOT
MVCCLRMKNKLLILLILFVIFLATSCSITSGGQDKIVDKILNLPVDYSIEQAEKDGFVVIDSGLNEQIKEIDSFIENFYSKDKKLITIDENYIINFYEIFDARIILFSYDLKNQNVIQQHKDFFRIKTEKSDDEAEVLLYPIDDSNLIIEEEKHLIYRYKIVK